MLDWLEMGALTTASDPGSAYQELLETGLFALRTCRTCQIAHYPPRVACPACGSTSLGWTRSAGTGAVYSVSVISPKEGDPYAVALVDLDDGPRLMTNVVGIDPFDVTIGLRVVLRIGERDGQAAPLFAPLSNNEGEGKSR